MTPIDKNAEERRETEILEAAWARRLQQAQNDKGVALEFLRRAGYSGMMAQQERERRGELEEGT